MTPSASAESDDSASATATAESDDESASASASALPETGGPKSSAFALASLTLLVAGGLFAARLVRS